MSLKAFGVYFSKLREESGFRSQRELADKSGVSHSTINRIEAGTHKASPETLKTLSHFLKGVTYEELLEKLGYIGHPNYEVRRYLKDINQDKSMLGKFEPERYWREINGDDKSFSDPVLSIFLKRLNQGIKEKDLSIEEIADYCRVSTDYIENLTTNPKKLPGVGTLYKLAELLDVTPDYLGGYTDDPQGRSPHAPKPKDLKEIMENQEVLFDGIPMSEADRQKVLGFMEAMFWDAKQKNKRKK